jgi:HMG-I and HMG-Y, DNA-binding: regulatory protein, tetR
VATPGDSADAAGAGHEELDLILVALMEIAPGDPAVREALEVALSRAGITAEALGRRLLERAGIATSSLATATGKTSASPPT